MEFYKKTREFIAIVVLSFVTSGNGTPQFGFGGGVMYPAYKADMYSLVGASYWPEQLLGYTVDVFYDLDLFSQFFGRLSAGYLNEIENIEEIQVTFPITVHSFKNSFNYISISALPGIKLLDNNSVVPYLLLGPRYDILISKNIDTPNSYYDRGNKNVFGLTGVAGVSLKKLGLPVFGEIVYNHDLTFTHTNLSRWRGWMGRQKIKRKFIVLKIGIEF